MTVFLSFASSSACLRLIQAPLSDRLDAAFDVISDADLVRVAKAYLARFPPTAELRNEIQELIWALISVPEVPVRFRREVAVALQGGPLWLLMCHFTDTSVLFSLYSFLTDFLVFLRICIRIWYQVVLFCFRIVTYDYVNKQLVSRSLLVHPRGFQGCV
jgi:hypothetical protein